MTRTNYEIENLRRSYCVRPVGTLGTCGWINGVPWTARFFKSYAAASRWVKEN